MRRCGWILLAACSLICGSAWAQAQAEAPAAAASATASVTSAPAEVAPAPPPPPPPPLSCAAVTARAMAADLKLAQSSGAALAQLIELQDLALVQWRQVVQRCDGRARERAERLLADNERARAQLAEREQAGAQCELSFRDAQSMQELAKGAFGERRWVDAGALYRKAETLWDLAAEHCTGEQQLQAGKRREEAEVDGHNAEQCAPSFEQARDATGRLRTVGASAAPADRERASQIAETHWREATALCKGQALDLAKANAEALARERGTPWVVTHGARATSAAAPVRGSGFATVAAPALAPVAAVTVPAPVVAVAPVAAAAAVATAPAAGVLSRIGEAAQQALKTVKAAANIEPTGAPAVAPTVPPTTPSAVALPAGEVELRASTARYIGRFALDGSQRVSGEGRVEWSNGDRYEGALQAGLRQGAGRFIWANGQSFEGDWLNDEPQGRGNLKYAGGDSYEGQVQAGQPHGEGEMRYASGDRFKGLFRNGSPHGRGQYRWANGQSFEGDWNGLTPQGRGVLRFANGNVYEGEVRQGQPEGAGRMQYANGGVYEGQFEAGLAQGQGKYVWPGGDHYEGAWDKGRKHGKGTFFFASGERWVGRFEDDERSDEGVFHGK